MTSGRWSLLLHRCVLAQLERLKAASDKAIASDSRSRIIVYAWVNDENTLRSAGGKNDPYTVFRKMLSCGNPPDDWDTLLRQSSPQQADRPAIRR